ncbi:MAG: hypothetical protein WCP28_17580 [Actinomycetes bacterium]
MMLVVLGANVLGPRLRRVVMLASARVSERFDVCWSDEILEESEQTMLLIAKRKRQDNPPRRLADSLLTMPENEGHL